MTEYEKPIEDDIICPHCEERNNAYIVDDIPMANSREVMLRCAYCRQFYMVYYKFDKMVKLNEEKK